MVPPLPVDAHCYQNGNATTGIASLRRDGFASISPCAADCDNATVITVPVMFTKPAQFVFVNVQTATTGGSLRVGLVDESTGVPLHGRGLEQSVPIRGDYTRTMVQWRGKKGLSYDNIAEMRGKPFRLQFLRSKALESACQDVRNRHYRDTDLRTQDFGLKCVRKLANFNSES